MRLHEIAEADMGEVANGSYEPVNGDAADRAMTGKRRKRKNSINGAVQSPLETYLKEINEGKLLSPDEEKALGRRIQLGDAEARDEMTRKNLRLVVNIARSFTGKGLGLQDLIEEGNLGLLRAVEKFDPKMNTRFSTYASYWIKQSIKRALVNTAKTIRIPAYMVELLAKWRREEARLKDLHGTQPTYEKIAFELNLPPKKLAIIKKAMKVYGAPSTDSSAPAGETAWSIGEKIADDEKYAPDAQFTIKDNIETVLELLKKMDPREATVLRLRFGLIEGKDPMTLKEIGEALGLTRERVRQIESEALMKLYNALEGRQSVHAEANGYISADNVIRISRVQLCELLYEKFPNKKTDGINFTEVALAMGMIDHQRLACRRWVQGLCNGSMYFPMDNFMQALADLLQINKGSIAHLIQ